MPVVKSLIGNNPEGKKWNELYEQGKVAFYIPNWVLNTEDKNQSDTLTDSAIQESFSNFIEACGSERTDKNTALIGFSRGSGMALTLVSQEYQKNNNKYPNFVAAQIGSNSSSYHFNDETKVLITYGGKIDYKHFGTKSNGKYWGWAKDNDNLEVLLLDGKYGEGSLVSEHGATLKYQGDDDIANWFIDEINPPQVNRQQKNYTNLEN